MSYRALGIHIEKLPQKGVGEKPWHHDYDNVYVHQMMLINYDHLNCTTFITLCVGTHYDATCIEIRGQFVGVSFLLSQNVGHRDQTQVIRLGSKCLYLLSHLSPFTKLILSQITFHPQELKAIVLSLFSSF